MQRQNSNRYAPKETIPQVEIATTDTKLNKTRAKQRDIFRPKLIYNYINLSLKKSQ